LIFSPCRNAKMTNANATRRMIAPIQCVIGMPQLAASFILPFRVLEVRKTATVPGNRRASQMMNLLCGPNTVLAACVLVGIIAANIWFWKDPRFQRAGQNQFPTFLGGMVGGVIGLILDRIIGPVCWWPVF
jgi:hypothetical protein